MNTANLHRLFKAYIDQFNFTNTGGRDEYYKWVTANLFKSQWDDAISASEEALPDALQKLDRTVGNLVTSMHQQPFAALRDYAAKKRDPEGVRTLLKNLISTEGVNLASVQGRIDSFVDGANTMKDRYFPTSHTYKMDQRVAMVFLGLYDPLNFFLYKATPAREFADCIGFYDDWGSGSSMDISVYHRMCNSVIDEMKKVHNENTTGQFDEIDVLKVDEQRAQYSKDKLHEDPNHHILVYDLMYCSKVYHTIDDVPYKKPDSTIRKAVESRRVYAEQLLEKIEEAHEGVALLERAEEFWNNTITSGQKLRYKIIGRTPVVVTITSVQKSGNDWIAETEFQDGSVKRFGVLASLGTGILSPVDEADSEKMAGYLPFIKRADQIRKNLASLTEELGQYRDVLS